jgi:S-adenosylmethionine:tRNA ribosyltransferase-isomerase
MGGKRPSPPADVTQFDYALPPELIAQSPAEPRDSSRLLVVPHAGPFQERRFSDLPALLRPGDLLVANDTRVLPARLIGQRSEGGAVELLLLQRRAPGVWECLGKPGRRLRPGAELTFGGVQGRVIERDGDGELMVAFAHPGHVDVDRAVLDQGRVPLPPYIRGFAGDPERYQTVYAREPGSVAAPTAGLHFTPGLLEWLRRGEVQMARVTLHVGVGTFRPISAPTLGEHRMHAEWCEVGEEVIEAIARTRRAGGRVVAVGTTVVRTLESAALRGEGAAQPFRGWTDLFITPGFRFRAIDALITNFHLPRSTLLVLVSAFAGRERMLEAYTYAVERRFRFYSFGDAMLLL